MASKMLIWIYESRGSVQKEVEKCVACKKIDAVYKRNIEMGYKNREVSLEGD